MAREKSERFCFRMSPQEWELVEKRMAQTNILNKSAYLRKMAIDGHVIMLDSQTLTEIGKLLRITANNVNQISKRVNSGGEAYRDDVAEVNWQLTEIRIDFGKVLALWSEFDNTKLGKYFIPPPKITDFQENV